MCYIFHVTDSILNPFLDYHGHRPRVRVFGHVALAHDAHQQQDHPGGHELDHETYFSLQYELKELKKGYH